MDALYLAASWLAAVAAILALALARCRQMGRHADAGWRDAYQARYGEHLAEEKAALYREIADAAIARETAAKIAGGRLEWVPLTDEEVDRCNEESR